VTPAELATRFFLAFAVILLTCRAVSTLLGRAGQPPVVGEMIAGVLLGPSLLGALSPGLEGRLFPRALLPVIYVAGQLGLVALMYQAGRELRGYLRPGLGRSASTISLLGVTVPLVAGLLLTLGARGHVDLFHPHVSAVVTGAFVGVTLAITAFPMLARIIMERGLSGTRFGSIALACGAIDDLAAWILLAGVLSLAAGKLWPVAKAAAGAVLFAVLLLFVVRPLLRRLLDRPAISPETVLLVTMTLLAAAAWYTTGIGLYAVFGAFSIGLAMPPGAEQARPAMDGIGRLLVPMFFTYSGLNTHFAFLASPALLVFSLLAVVVAVLSKFGACGLGARLADEPGPAASRVVTLMNAPGLMQRRPWSVCAARLGCEIGLRDWAARLGCEMLRSWTPTTPCTC
jgi:Kef-type K+ transport system membrane component KefB